MRSHEAMRTPAHSAAREGGVRIHAELFANYTENFRPFVSAGTSGLFATSFAASLEDLRPEHSKTIEGRPSELQNVGSVRSWGVGASGTLALMRGLSATASYAYNHSTCRQRPPQRADGHPAGGQDRRG